MTRVDDDCDSLYIDPGAGIYIFDSQSPCMVTGMGNVGLGACGGVDSFD